MDLLLMEMKLTEERVSVKAQTTTEHKLINLVPLHQDCMCHYQAHLMELALVQATVGTELKEPMKLMDLNYSFQQ